MTTLTINDLARTDTLDGKAMTAVRGGHGYGYRPLCWLPSYDFSSRDDSVKATQSIGQSQDVFNANGNNVFGAEDIRSTVKPVQTASNNIFA